MIEYLSEHSRWMSFVGVAVLLGIAYFFSSDRKKVDFNLVFKGLGMQFILAYLILWTTYGGRAFAALASGFEKLYLYADQGSKFLFGNLANPATPWGFVFAIKVLPIIIFFGALMSVLFHLGIVQGAVKALSILIRPILGTSGAETLCAAANSMLGATEAPLLVKNYLGKMTDSEILVVMVSGMATLSGSILAVYGGMGVPMVHLLSASVMAIPASILISKILLPESKKPQTVDGKELKMDVGTNNILDAIAQGTGDGLRLAVNIGAMLVVFISLIAMTNSIMGGVTNFIFGTEITLDVIFSKLFCYIAYLMGINSSEMYIAGKLLGQKLVINEMVAYSSMVKEALSTRSQAILTYALCGFSNFSVIGIQIGGIGALVPEKRHKLIELGFIALLGGTLANFLNATIAALFI